MSYTFDTISPLLLVSIVTLIIGLLVYAAILLMTSNSDTNEISNSSTNQSANTINRTLNRCNHNWFPMVCDSQSYDAHCDFKVVRTGNQVVNVQAVLPRDSHPLGSNAIDGNLYYVCHQCFATRCMACHEAAGYR